MQAKSAAIRPATFADAAGIAAVHVAAWREAYQGIVPDAFLAQLSVDRRRAQWEAALAKPAAGECLHVACAAAEPERIVGFVSAGATRFPELPFAGELYAIYLLRAFQGAGTGAALFERATHDLVASGRASMMLWVLADNRTVGFYERMGGRTVSSKVEDIGGKPLTELALGWDQLG